MRNAFASELTQLAKADSNIVLLSGDIGNRLFDDFKKNCPGRFYNCGVAEANMVSMAAGMSLAGLRPITYTIASFMTTRCLEQIRVDVAYHSAPVIIVGVGGGLAYAANGGTHHSCEDIGILRLLPEMTVICPGDPVEVRLALRCALQHEGPVYIRLGKKGEPSIHQSEPAFEIGRGIVVKSGNEVCLISTGNMLPVTVDAGQELERRGVSTQVVSLHTVKPLDRSLLGDVFTRFKLVATVEEHSVLGGLGGSIAEWLAFASEEAPVREGRLVRFGTPDAFLHEAGGQDYARERVGLTVNNIVQTILDRIEEPTGKSVE